MIIVTTLADSVGTLVVARGVAGRWRPTRAFYLSSWRVWRSLGRRLGRGQETFLAAYAPLSLLILLSIWLLGQLVGWSLIYLAGEGSLEGASGFLSILYYSGISLLTVGFGDITSQSSVLRFLTLFEAAIGLLTIALVISYLPALYGAYGRRETRLLTLDDPSGERLQPASVITIHAMDGDVERLFRFFAEWEEWTADILESHVSYPMLAYFRSQHRGQAWITALGVVVDAASLTCAIVPGADQREPYFMYRRGARALAEIAVRLHLRVEGQNVLDRSLFAVAHERIKATGLPCRDPDEAWERLLDYRGTYGTTLQSLIDNLLAPPGFWGHSAEDLSSSLAVPRR